MCFYGSSKDSASDCWQYVATTTKRRHDFSLPKDRSYYAFSINIAGALGGRLSRGMAWLNTSTRWTMGGSSPENG